MVVTNLGAIDEDGEEVTGYGATVEILSRETELIKKIYEEMRDDYEETDIWNETTYNCAVEVWANACFTTYGSPDDIETIIKTAEAIAEENARG